MADSFSTLLGLRYQQTGGNDNTWGELLNTDVFEVVEKAVTGVDVHTVTGGAEDLSASPLVGQVQLFVGTLASDATVTLPNLHKTMWIGNFTTGSFFLLVKVAGSSTTRCIPQGTRKLVRTDGAGGIARLDASSVGEVFYYAGAAVPAGAFECDGATPLRASVPDLFAAIGTTWGAGNGTTTFTLPDLKTAGRFIRSRTGSVAVGTYQAEMIGPHGHTTSGSVSGTISQITPAGTISPSSYTPVGTIPNHSHSLPSGGGFAFGSFSGGADLPNGYSSGGLQLSYISLTASQSLTFSGSAQSFTFAGTPTTPTFSGSISVTVNNNSGTENRPVTAVMMACIRY